MKLGEDTIAGVKDLIAVLLMLLTTIHWCHVDSLLLHRILTARLASHWMPGRPAISTLFLPLLCITLHLNTNVVNYSLDTL